MTGRIGKGIAALVALLLMTAGVQACGRSDESTTQDAGSGDSEFKELANEILEFTYKSDPSNATYLGIHKYDNQIGDYSAAGVKADVEDDQGLPNPA